MVELYDYQKEALENLRSGSILCGGVGTGKSKTSLAYFLVKECDGSLNFEVFPKKPKDLYIITTARKRDTGEWLEECSDFLLTEDPGNSLSGIKVTIDSWNNIKKYLDVKDSFFIFDEQRVVGKGSWVKSFLKIAKSNRWILLSATPGDTWSDYIPVFVANGFFKNRTEFLREHAIFSRFSKYPKIEKYYNTGKLLRLRRSILVPMDDVKTAVKHFETISVDYDKDLYKLVSSKRWNPYEEAPIAESGELCYIMRKVVNSDESRKEAVLKLLEDHPKAIVFYNFNYELDILRSIDKEGLTIAEWNGHKKELIPQTDSWLYLVQYTAGAEGWNCIETDTVIFFSQNYSYKITTQAAGRIDRLNTPFKDLYYYNIRSKSPIDLAILRALKNKKNFNENDFLNAN